MVMSNSESQLRQVIASWMPALNLTGCYFTPVQGLTGESWRIESDHLHLLARQQTAEKCALGVSRRREATVLNRVGRGIGPTVLLQHTDWLIVEWLKGENLDITTFAAMNCSGELARLVARLHQRKRSGYPLALQQQLARYWQQIDHQRLTPVWLRWQRYFMQQKMPNPLMLAPLHMDIHAGNLLRQGEQLRLIDWEYAADGDIALELAALFRFNQFSPAAQQQFLSHYTQLGYTDLPQLTRQIQRWLPWVDYLMLMWFEVRWNQCRDPAFLLWGAALYQRFCLASSINS
ncbi:LPS biosynthesis choline kinase [Serratia sp. S1B]|nr:LPS biosynthesis choline kinase [Serratia sp. S1B]